MNLVELYRFAMGCVTIGIRPRVFSRQQGSWIGQILGRCQAFERGQPMLVVMGTVVRLSTIGRGLQFLGKCRCPFLPREVALLGELYCERERLGLPRFREY